MRSFLIRACAFFPDGGAGVEGVGGGGEEEFWDRKKVAHSGRPSGLWDF